MDQVKNYLEKLVYYFFKIFNKIFEKPFTLLFNFFLGFKSLKYSSPLFSIITVANNTLEYNKFIGSLNKQEVLHFLVQFVKINNETHSYSAPQALNLGLKRAIGKYVIFCHQDIRCSTGWLQKLFFLISRLEKIDKNWGVLGIAGTSTMNTGGKISTKNISNESNTLTYHPKWWYEVQTLDEFCLIIRKNSLLTFDEKSLTDFHFYGADLCLTAISLGMKNYVLKLPTLHRSTGGGNLKSNYSMFRHQAKILYQKWGQHFSCFSTTTAIFSNGRVKYLIGIRDGLDPSEENFTIKSD